MCSFRPPKKVSYALNENDLKEANITRLNIMDHDFTKDTNMCTRHYMCLNKDKATFLLLKFKKRLPKIR